VRDFDEFKAHREAGVKRFNKRNDTAEVVGGCAIVATVVVLGVSALAWWAAIGYLVYFWLTN
jgi:hypothetical protein